MKPYSLLVIGGRGREPQQIAELIHSACPSMIVDTIPSGHEAFFYLCGKKPSAIMIDFMLPDIDGLSFLKIVHDSSRMAGIPVLIMSGTYTEPADRAAVLFAGASGFVQKPSANEDYGWGMAFCRELAYQLKISIEQLNSGINETVPAYEQETPENSCVKENVSASLLPEETGENKNISNFKPVKSREKENRIKSARGRKRKK